MSKKNIIYIQGRDSYGVDLEKEKLIKAFKERQNAHNIDIIRIEEVKDWRTVEQDVFSMGLFAEKRLFCFSGWYTSKWELDEKVETTKESKKNSKAVEAENMIEKLCENIPDDHFFIFTGMSFRSRSTLAPWLEKNADKRSFDILWNTPIWQKRFPNLREEIIREVINIYRKMESSNEEIALDLSYALVHTFEKISLIAESREIKKNDIDDSLIFEWWGKIFDLTDTIQRGDHISALKIFRSIIETMNIYACIASLIGLLRTAVYVKYLKEHGEKEWEIKKYIKAHPFMIQKAYESRISYVKIRDFYHKILSINIAYHSGQWMKDPELWRILEIELAIIGLKK